MNINLTQSTLWSRLRGPECQYHQICKQQQQQKPFFLRYLSELCCVDGPLGAGQATFPVVSALFFLFCKRQNVIHHGCV